MLSWRNKKNINTFGLKKKKHLIKSYVQCCLKIDYFYMRSMQRYKYDVLADLDLHNVTFCCRTIKHAEIREQRHKLFSKTELSGEEFLQV